MMHFSNPGGQRTYKIQQKQKNSSQITTLLYLESGQCHVNSLYVASSCLSFEGHTLNARLCHSSLLIPLTRHCVVSLRGSRSSGFSQRFLRTQ